MGFLIWDFTTRTDLSAQITFHSGNLVGTTVYRILNSSSIVGQVTYINGSVINVTVTIMRPINLNGSTVVCNNDMLTLNIPTRTGKFLVTSIEI